MLQGLAPASIYDPPSLLYTILTQPLKTLIRILDHIFNLLRSQPYADSPRLRVVCISDTHCLETSEIPDGDLLIHAGDLANVGNLEEIQAQIDWLDGLPHEYKVVIAGNHDRLFDPRSRDAITKYTGELQPARPTRKGSPNWKSLRYLQHSSAELQFRNGRRLNIYGAPQTPADGTDDFAFRYPRGTDAWTDTIPRDTDILVTHTPPKFHLDLPAGLGCEYLLREVWKVQPILHVYGHVHAGKTDFIGQLKGGKEMLRWDNLQRCLEEAQSRPDGLVRGLIDPSGWLDVLKVVLHGIIVVIWERIWGGSSATSTTMVLASLMYCNTGHLGNPPIVVEI